MAGCAIILVYFLFLAVVAAAAAAVAVFFGTVFGCALAAIVSTVAYIVLLKKGFFEKYRDSEKAVLRIAPVLLRVFLIIAMALSWLMTAGFAVLIYILR